MKELLAVASIMFLIAIAFPQSTEPTVISHRHIEGGEYDNVIFNHSHIEGATIRNSQIYNSGVYVSRIYDSYVSESYLWSNYMNNTEVIGSEFEGGEIWWNSVANSYIGWGTNIREGWYVNSTFEHADLQSPKVNHSTIMGNTEARGTHLQNVLIEDSRVYYSGIENTEIRRSNLSDFHIVNGYVGRSRLENGEVSNFFMEFSWLNYVRLNNGETHDTEYNNVVACSVWNGDTQTFYPPCEPNGPFTVINPS